MKVLQKLFIGVISLLALVGCSGSGDGKYNVHFDTNTEMAVSTPKDQSIAANKRCRKPTIFVRQDNPDNYQVSGWFKEKDLQNEWNFKTDLVTSNMTLYAKWSKEFKVTYNIGSDKDNIQKNINSTKVFDGFTLTEDKTVALGYNYLGTYVDENFTQPFDYSKPVTSNLDLYIKRSPTILLSDDQNLCNGTGYLYENLEPAMGSPDDAAVLGDVDTYTTSSGEVCTKVNFGYAPKYGDPYVELSLNLDITHSKEIKITYKNLGKSERMSLYFTAINDLENSIYSETGQNYTQDFCIDLNTMKNNMKESDPWETYSFDLSSVKKYGYSIWGSAKYLGRLRIQVTYKNTSFEDLSNVMLIKSIEGVNKDVTIEDSDPIAEEWAKTYTEQELAQKSGTQTQNDGFIFPKNFAQITTPGEYDNAEIKNTTNGLLIHTDNSVAIKERVDKLNKEAGEAKYSTNSVVTMTTNQTVSLDDLSTFKIKIKNYGYAQKLNITVRNDKGGAYSFELDISPRSNEFSTYTANLYGMAGIQYNLKDITITYNAIGVDNLLCIEEMYFSPFKRYDTVGLNFYDKNCLGFKTDDNINVAFDKGSSATIFTMYEEQNNTEIVSDSTFTTTTDGYTGLKLNYILPPDLTELPSTVSTVKVSFYSNSSWTEPIVFNINTSEKSWQSKSISAAFPTSYQTGPFTKVKLIFTGQGRFLIKDIAFESSENTLPYNKSYETLYSRDKDWVDSNTTYRYDLVNACSTFAKTKGEFGQFRMYIGYAVSKNKNPPHTCLNIPVDGKKAIKVVYQNRTAENKFDLTVGLDKTDDGPSDGSECPTKVYVNTIKTNMEDYEWDTLSIDISSDVKIVEWLGLYIAKFNCKFYGTSINIRSITVM